jgi:hypothetical protein
VRPGVIRRGKARNLKEASLEISKRTQDKASEDYLKLLNYVSELPQGEMIVYSEIELLLDIKMDASGKDKLRRAIISCGKEYSLVKNIGYKLAQPDSCMPILGTQILRIKSAAKVAKRKHENLSDFYGSLTEDEQRGFNYAGAIIGAIAEASNKDKNIFSKDIRKIADSKPLLPD